MKGLLTALVTTGAILAPGAAWAVNCAQVNRYLQTGRTPQEVSETMVISEDEVKKCQEEAAKSGGQASPGGAEGAQGTAAPSGQQK